MGVHTSIKYTPSYSHCELDSIQKHDHVPETTEPDDTKLRVCNSAPLLESWCKSMGLADEVLNRLRNEKFMRPEHLMYLDKEELELIVNGLKLGDKGGFYHAVHILRQAE